jgi:hypothetical protein
MAFSVEKLKKMAIDLGQTGLNLAQGGLDRGLQLASAAKYKASNIKEEGNLRAAFAELGRMYFADHGAEPEEAYAVVCNQIADIQAAIAANNAKIAEMKVTPDVEEEVEAAAEAVAEAEAAADELETKIEEAAETVEKGVCEQCEEPAAEAEADDDSAPV